jgi:hypothetical protein
MSEGDGKVSIEIVGTRKSIVKKALWSFKQRSMPDMHLNRWYV